MAAVSAGETVPAGAFVLVLMITFGLALLPSLAVRWQQIRSRLDD